MDRHVYAWNGADSNPDAPGGAGQVDGFPVLVVDPAKVASVDPDDPCDHLRRRREPA